MQPVRPQPAAVEAVLYEGLEGGRAAYALKLHHAATDGMGITDRLGGLHRPTRKGDPNRPGTSVRRSATPWPRTSKISFSTGTDDINGTGNDLANSLTGKPAPMS